MAALRNPFDQVRPAGKRFVGRDEAVSYCLQEQPAAAVPPEIAAYRLPEIGARAPHAMLRLHPPNTEGMVAGKVFHGERVGSKDVLDFTLTPMAALIEQKAEQAVYKSALTERLGKGYSGGGTLPERTLRADFRFGASTHASDAAKETVFPPPGDPEEEKKEEIYQRSHHSFAPGKQRRDRVDWTVSGLDPHSHKFGRPQVSTERNIVGKCLNPELDRKSAVAVALVGTQIVNKTTDDFRAWQDYSLEKTRAAALTDKAKHPEVYGRPAMRSSAGDWGTGDSIRGDCLREEQQPDADLGKAVTHGFRNAGFADATRRFGLPSVRTDVAPRAVSVASTVDFGTGPKSAELLFPSPYADHGVEEGDFTAPRGGREVRSLMEKIGYAMADAEFGALFARAASHGHLTPPGSVCLAEFRAVLNEVLGARDGGAEPEWFTLAVDGPPGGQ